MILTANLELFEESLSILSTKFKQNLKSYLNTKDIEGTSPILYAAYRGNIQIIEILIEKGADYHDTTNKQLNVIHMASQGDNPNVIIYFKDKYNMSILDVDINGNTPLHWACYNCADHSVNYLLAYMNNINIQNNIGQTPLHIAIFTERVRIIKKLINRGIDILIRDNDNKNAIQLAIQNTGASSKVTRTLIENKPLKSWFFNNTSVQDRFINSITFLFFFVLYSIIIYFTQLRYLSSKYSFLFLIINCIYFIVFYIINKSNPGYIESKNDESWLDLVKKGEDINNMCPYCKIRKEKFSKHCYTCEKCVKEQAHHCILFGNCVGKENKYLYIFYLTIIIIYFAVSYFISFRVFLLPEIRINKQKPYLAIFIFFKETFRDFIAILVMTNAIFAFGICGFLIFKQIRKMVINEKMKEM